MINRTVARRYAEALYAAAAEAGVADEVERRLAGLAGALDEDARLRRLVEDRRLPRQRRKAVLVGLLGQEPPRLLVHFVQLLVDKQRVAYLRDIYREYHAGALSARNMAEAELVAAVELPERTVQRIRERLEAITGKRIQVALRVDPDIIGGIVVRIGDRRLDASLRRRLGELHRAIAGPRRRGGEGVLVR